MISHVPFSLRCDKRKAPHVPLNKEMEATDNSGCFANDGEVKTEEPGGCGQQGPGWGERPGTGGERPGMGRPPRDGESALGGDAEKRMGQCTEASKCPGFVRIASALRRVPRFRITVCLH